MYAREKRDICRVAEVIQVADDEKEMPCCSKVIVPF